MPDSDSLVGQQIDLRLSGKEAPDLALGAELGREVLLLDEDAGWALLLVLGVYNLNLVHLYNYKITSTTNGIFIEISRIQSRLFKTRQKITK